MAHGMMGGWSNHALSQGGFERLRKSVQTVNHVDMREQSHLVARAGGSTGGHASAAMEEMASCKSRGLLNSFPSRLTSPLRSQGTTSLQRTSISSSLVSYSSVSSPHYLAGSTFSLHEAEGQVGGCQKSRDRRQRAPRIISI